MPSVYRDSGVFLYIGWRILNGELPYRDIWDHKPPLIFYINALGLAITNPTRWGVWLLEFASLFLAALIGFYLLKKALGIFPAIYSLLLGLLTLTFIIEGGNLTEEFTLPLQFFALWLIYDADKYSFSFWRLFLIGFIGAIAFFTKQVTIGIWIAIIIYLTLTRLKHNQTRQWIKEILSFGVGGLVVCTVIILFFGIQGTLEEFWNAAFKYNFIYFFANNNLAQKLEPLLTGITPLTKVGLFQFAIIGYGLGIVLILFRKDIISNWTPLLFVGLIDLPIELILISVSGQFYGHYYMVLLPALFIFSGLTFWVILSQLSSWNVPNVAKLTFQLSIIGIFLWSSYSYYRAQVSYLGKVNNETISNYIEFHTYPNDYVLLWGAESSINFSAQRRSPTRFVYQYPIYKQGYVDEKMILEFLEDIIQNRPSLIIDTKNHETPMYSFPIQTESIREDVEYLKTHYRMVEKLGNWDVYEYIESESTEIR
jgi:hypothetical protein